MDDLAAILEANRSFYRAFASGAFADLAALLAPEDAVTAHPWRPAVHGRAQVLEGWRAILEAGPPPIRCLAPQVSRFGDAAVVTCIEDTGGEPCIATNVFVRVDGAWRLAHHHGAPLAPGFLSGADAPPNVVH